MPCLDPDSPHSSHVVWRFESLACALIRASAALDVSANALFDAVDWAEAGVDRTWAENWWREHLVRDQQRRAEEAAKLERERLRESARSKLTAAERRALGL